MTTPVSGFRFQDMAMTVKQCARATNTCDALWRRMIAREEVRTIRIGRCIRVPRAEFLRIAGALAPVVDAKSKAANDDSAA
jgi:hypothetical protein